MSTHNLDKLLKPASVAVIGASPIAGTVGFVLARNIMRAGYGGRLLLVNPHHDAIGGRVVFPDVAHLPETPDLAVLATPPATLPGLIAELGARGTRAAVVITTGFAELGEAGRALRHQVMAAARPHHMRIVGPSCVGVMVPGIGLDASVAPIAPLRGDLAFVSQSGTLVTAVLDWAAARSIGFSHVVSLGDMADVDFGDMLDFLAADADTRAILLYLEGVTQARKFMSAARAAARSKPVLVVKVGRFAETERAARSHTGALAGADAVYDAAFRRAGMLRVSTMTELFDAVETLAQTGPQRGEHLAIITNSGGAGVLATDALVADGGRLAALAPETMAQLEEFVPGSWSHGNPVDILGDADGPRYARALGVLVADPAIDAVLVLNCPTALTAAADSAHAVIATLQRMTALLAGRNVLTAWLGDSTASEARRLFAAAHIATYDTPDSAVRGFMHRVHYRRNQELLMETPPVRPQGPEPDAARAAAAIARGLDAGRQWLDPEDVAEVLAAYRIPSPAYRIAADAAAAAQAAAEFGAPVALKIRSPDIAHKSDAGGVALDLRTPERVRAEAEAMLARVAAAAPLARIEGFLVQPMARQSDATHLIIGIAEDAVFGPVVLFGQGGALVEMIGDTTLELPPLNTALARAQMARTRVFRLLQGYRGAAPADLDAVTAALVAVAQLAAEQPAIKELDLNPLLADKDGVIALDARIRVAPATQPAEERLAIRPYPHQLESRERLRDGTPITLRPIRPEDEPLLQDIVRHMNPEDLRLRFFAPVHAPLTHQLAARLSQIDYDREMALIALTAEGGTALGVARFAADPNGSAEYAIGIRSDWQGRGLGSLLMHAIIAVATARGIGELFGDVLHENQAMRELARSLGFAVTPHPDDPAVVRVRKRLE